ncbi:MAG: retroviral-like aspartic protease family protein [Sphingobium sp.]
MRNIHALAAVLTLCLATPAAANEPLPPAGSDEEKAVIPLHDPADERVTVPVSIDGKGPWHFVVDTGAQRTVISRALADELALTRGAMVTVLSMTGTSQADTVALPRLGFGQGTVDNIEAPVLEGQHLGAAGLLGLDGLQSKRLLLDFRSGRMEISRSRRAAVAGDAILVEARRRRGQLILLDSDINGMRVNIVLDTGTDISVGNIALMEKLMRQKRAPKLSRATLTSVTGETLTGLAGAIDTVRMGRVTLKGLGVLFADAAPFAELGLRDKPALLLGINALRVFDRVAIDFGTSRVDFLLPDLGAMDKARFAEAGAGAG